jgi:hypothetical protein
MYITTHTSHFNLAETGPGVYWGTLGAASLETLNFDFVLLQAQTFLLASRPVLLDIADQEYVSKVVDAWPTSKACACIQLVGVAPTPDDGAMEIS